MHTLVIDDDPLALTLPARQLERPGCVDVALYEGARETMTPLETRSGTIRLVFCELQMPNIDGKGF